MKAQKEIIKFSRSWARKPIRDLNRSKQKINKAHRTFLRSSADQTTLPNIAEWLLDNHYILRRLSGDIVKSLKKNRLPSPLPVVTGGKHAGAPRIQVLAEEYIEKHGYVVESEDLCTFMDAAQSVAPFCESELAVLFIMVSLALLKKIGEICANNRAKGVKESDNAIILGNCFNSLRELDGMDQQQMVEKLSKVENILAQDAVGMYEKMTSETKTLYRNRTAELAYKSHIGELDQARKALDSAKQQHVGRPLFSGCKHKRPLLLYTSLIGVLTLLLTTITVLAFGVFRNPLILLLFVLALLPISDMAVSLVNLILAKTVRPRPLPRLEFTKDVGVPDECRTLVVVPTIMTDVKKADEMVSRMETHYLGNQDKNVYFMLLGDWNDSNTRENPGEEAVYAACLQGIKRLNKKYASVEHPRFLYLHRKRVFNEKQGAWIGYERKRGGLEQLNSVLLSLGETGEINSPLFEVRSHNRLPFSKIKYVVTLDSDTLMQHDTVARLVGTMAHPLNLPRLSKDGKTVVDGYALIQPRVICTAKSAEVSPFATIYSGDAGMDMYSGTLSDVYQDLFGEGIFTGKGIYDLEVFSAITTAAIPENTVLSHDLLEGSFVRAAVDSGTTFADGNPSTYPAYAKRLHRWVRGDWQLLPWLGRKLRFNGKTPEVNPLSASARWRIFDNLRRSLVAPAVFLLVLLSFVITEGNPLFWTVFAFVSCVFPALPSIIVGSVRKILHPVHRKIRLLQPGAFNDFLHACMEFLLLPSKALSMLNAVFTTLGRVLFTHKNMLEWVTADETEKRLKNTPLAAYYFMKNSLIVLTVWTIPVVWRNCSIYERLDYSAVADIVIRPEVFLYVGLLLLWALAPLLVWVIGRPFKPLSAQLTKKDCVFLRESAFSTWQYFDTFINAQTMFLPPDNFQEYPAVGVAERTSPTNIGLGLLSVTAANRLGYVDISKTADILLKTLESTDRLEKWNGHLLNWYTTTDMKPLMPMYISTVDSGNFVCCLMALRQGVQELKKDIEKEILIGEDGIARINEKYSVGIRDSLKHLLNNLNREANDLLEKDNPFLKIVMIEEMLSDHGLLLDGESLRYIKHSLISLLKQNKQLESTGEGMNHETEVNVKRCLALINDLCGCLNAANDEQFKSSLERKLDRIAEICDRMIEATDFRPLYNDKNKLFSIGFDLSTQKLTKSYYDLYASESRLASFAAIALNQVPAEHWSKLGRTPVSVDGRTGPVSWTGTMFEYLMPGLLMRTYRNTLAEQATQLAVSAQQRAARGGWAPHGSWAARGGWVAHRQPWGISESAFCKLDRNRSYCYKAFGLPGLRLKFEAAGEHVVSPYSTMLALGYAPADSVRNLRRLRSLGLFGRFGFYEAVDFTKKRMPYKKDKVIVRSYMIHHQGMSLLAMTNILEKNVIQKWFHSYPAVKATDLLLQEKPLTALGDDTAVKQQAREKQTSFAGKSNVVRTFEHSTVTNTGKSTHTTDVSAGFIPAVQYMTNGEYTVMVDQNGSGFSRLNETYLTPFNPAASSMQGTFIYAQHLTASTCCLHDCSSARFSAGTARFNKKFNHLDIHTDICVHPQLNAEVRTVTFKNTARETCTLEVSAYGDCALSPIADYNSHPAFANLFIRTLFNPVTETLYAYRKPRSAENNTTSKDDDFEKLPQDFSFENRLPWMGMSVVTDSKNLAPVEFETDKYKFIGRNHTEAHPIAMNSTDSLSSDYSDISSSDGTAFSTPHSTLSADEAGTQPIFALRRKIVVPPMQSVKVSFVIAMADCRNDIDRILWSLRTPSAIRHAFRLADEYGQLKADFASSKNPSVIGSLNVLPLMQNIPALTRPTTAEIADCYLGKKDLWAFGISGDLPIMTILLSDGYLTECFTAVIGMFEFWRSFGFVCDLVLLIDEQDSYHRPLEKEIIGSPVMRNLYEYFNSNGGVHVVPANTLSYAQKCLFHAASSVVFDACKPFAEQLQTQTSLLRHHGDEYSSLSSVNLSNLPEASLNICDYLNLNPSSLLFFNGNGGFDTQTGEYKIILQPGIRTPLPWSNVVANPNFGFVATESGGGFSWSDNSHDFRLTPWSNDPVCDAPGELLYLSDENTCFPLTPIGDTRELPSFGGAVVTYGHGYIIYEGITNGYYHRLVQFVPFLLEDTSADSSVLSSEEISPHTRVGIVYVKRLTPSSTHESNSNTTPKEQPSKTLMLNWNLKPVLGVAPQAHTAFLKGMKLNARTLLLNNTEEKNFAGKIAWLATNTACQTGYPISPTVAAAEINCSFKLRLEETADGLEGTSVFLLGTSDFLPSTSNLSDIKISGFAENHSAPLTENVLSLSLDKLENVIVPAVNRFLSPENAETAFEATKTAWKRLFKHSATLTTPSTTTASIDSTASNNSGFSTVVGSSTSALSSHETVSLVESSTPADTAFNLMVSGWLPYQTIACRLFGRSAFYQSGGAFGYRDQLQDAINIVDLLPNLTRSQILLHCSRQFIEGDVQHWWHEPDGMGSRTRISDDRLWLPYAVIEYVEKTGDFSILQEKCGYLRGPAIPDDKADICICPEIIPPNISAAEQLDLNFSVVEHCCKAIDLTLRFGEHGLPLMFEGDWNDGMNRVGIEGKGESVWLAWFLTYILRKFANLCELYSTPSNNKSTSPFENSESEAVRLLDFKEKAEFYQQTADTLRENIEKHAWDGEWYLRAWYDNGAPMGSKNSDDCKIDAISQAWAVLSGAGNPERTATALASVEKHLVDRENGLIRLLTPAFQQGENNPGYIKSYLPGVRENGGQYTHAAAWCILAALRCGDGGKARELFDLINPVLLSASPDGCSKYRGEPYVLAADVYTTPGLVGQAGWTWYSGSAGWMYSAGKELLHPPR